MDTATWISLGSAIISVAAAGFSFSQANAARRQAAAAHGELDPTFHITKTSNVGMPPWRFELVVNNFNRRAIDLLEVGISVPDCLVYEDEERRKDTIRSIVQSATQKSGMTLFDYTRSVGFTLSGVAPNSAEPARQKIAFAFGPKVETSFVPHIVTIAVRVAWQYADGGDRFVTEFTKELSTAGDV